MPATKRAENVRSWSRGHPRIQRRAPSRMRPMSRAGLNDLIRLLAAQMGIDRRELYQAVVTLKHKSSE